MTVLHHCLSTGTWFYAGGSPAYTAKCDEVAAKGYEGFVFR